MPITNTNYVGSTIFAYLAGFFTIAAYTISNLGPIESNDLWWHMALGRHYIETMAMTIDHSTLSWTPAQDDIYNHWLGAISLYLLYEAGGTYALTGLRFAVFGLVIFLTWRFAKRHSLPNHPLIWLVILTSLSIAKPAMLVKPSLMSVGFMTLCVWLYYHVRQKGDDGRYLVYLFPLIIIVWQNTHGGFFLVSLFFLSTIVGEILNYHYSPGNAMPDSLRRNYLAALTLCIPALLVNPYGTDLPIHIITTVTSGWREDFSFVAEYRETSSLNGPPFYLLNYMLLGMAMFLVVHIPAILKRKADWVAILSFIVYCALFVKMIRTTPYFSPILAFAIVSALPKDSWGSIKTNWITATAATLLTAIIFLKLTPSLKYCGSYFATGLVPPHAFTIGQKPVDAANYIEENIQATRIGNIYNDGGYLLYRFWPEKTVMIDSRSFPYLSWINQYFTTTGDNIKNFLESYKPDFWVLPYYETILIKSLIESKNWKPVFYGTTSMILVPTKWQLTTTISPEFSSTRHPAPYTNAMQVLLRSSELDFAEKLINIAEKSLDLECDVAKIAIQDYHNALRGIRAFNNERYLEAADLFKSMSHFPILKSWGGDIYSSLGKDSYNRGAFNEARSYFISAYRTYDENAWTDLYNIAISDWAARNTKQSAPPQDKFHWRELAKILSNNSGEFEDGNRQILHVASRMLANSYDGQGTYLPRSTELSR
jgi:hypothetical protein